jgi:UDP-2,3-diacylglucosamine pyrophosphatase LpxH
LILSDTHLSREYGRSTSSALASLLAHHRDAELILAGDIFDLSLDAARVPASDSLAEVIAAHEQLRTALQSHLQAGRRVTLVPGNHDAALTNPSAIEALRRCLRVPDERQLTVSPWFVRRGDVHIEHGHLYDPDNAPNHPLGGHDPRTEPLGTALMRRFVAPNDALVFAHAHETTPVSGLSTAFRLWGVRAPWVVARYFATAFRLCAEAARGERAFEAEVARGERALAAHAHAMGLDPTCVARLLELAPMPTHRGFRDTFLRLYFDRIFATLSVAAGLGLLGAAGLGATGLGATGLGAAGLGAAGLVGRGVILPGAGALLTALGAGYLLHDVTSHQSRYSGLVVPRLGEAAGLVRQTTGASLVVFGHTHVEVNEPGYVNLGSFGYARGQRPYLALDAGQAPSLLRAS